MEITLEGTLYYLVFFAISLLINAFLLFLVSKILQLSSATFSKAMKITFKVYIVLLIVDTIGTGTIWVLGKYFSINEPWINFAIVLAIVVISILYYIKLISKNYKINAIKSLLLIILVWGINIVLIWLANRYLVPVLELGIYAPQLPKLPFEIIINI